MVQLNLYSARQDRLITGVVEYAQLAVWDGSVWAPARDRDDRPRESRSRASAS